MNFARPKKRRITEPALPMINVVFLLLIFFLMSAQISPPSPFDVSPPSADVESAAAGEVSLYLSETGSLGFQDARDADVWAAMRNLQNREESVLLLRADAALPANRLAGVLAQLSELGFAEIHLVTRSQ